MNSSNSRTVVIVIVVLIILCMCSVLAVGVFGLIAYRVIESGNETSGAQTPFNYNPPTQVLPTSPFTAATPAAPVIPEAVSEGALETLERLSDMIVPMNDPIGLAERIGGVKDIETVIPDQTDYQVGDRKVFWVTNTDSNETFRVQTTLRKVVPSAYFWIEDGADYNQRELDRLAGTFDTEIYPTDREFFGSEYNPGIDDNLRLFIVYAHGMGYSTAAYFSSVDSVPPAAHKYSNAHETFMINADTVGLGEEYTYGVLAHEFQHMIHWNNDRNEDSWVNEGFSELATFLNNYDPGGFDYLFARDPDMQLTDWPLDSDARAAHYGSSFLFVSYFLDRFGEDATKALVADSANGMAGFENALSKESGLSELNGKLSDQFFADWTVANYLNNPAVDDGKYAYQSYDMVPGFTETDVYSNCSDTSLSTDVSQFGTDYIAFECVGPFTLSFQGQAEVGVLSQGAKSGDYAFWSNSSDESDMTLTQTFDFTDVSAPIEMNYSAWYNIEEDYDYAYLEASTDGETWEILSTPSCTSADPSGNSYGCGYNGFSRSYLDQTVDLSQFAGQEVQLRFEYVTDAAVTGEGLLLDDISIPAIDYSTDFETDDGGWIAEGFVRIQNRLPQTFAVTLIDGKEAPVVTTIQLDTNNSASMQVENFENQKVTLVVSGTTPFTREKALYSVTVQQ